MTSARISGFSDPVHESQAVYRIILRAMSQSGVPVDLSTTCAPPPPLTQTMGALALTLFDGRTPVWLAPGINAEPVRSFLELRTGASIADDARDADFILTGAADELTLAGFRSGNVFAPHTAATLIIGVPSLVSGRPVRLAGPGIADTVQLNAAGLDERFWEQWDANASGYPCGIDVLLVDGGSVCGLPRTTRRV
ncbi:phosphonate C-P lyase system protein PhnH [Burkholderia cepacia]|uniref:phosphonate C-P lyase system protein PhnH n=1 Tax=Burkholderia cepacia TaxID=292 RepID=UPI002AB6392A|nr:phosphonate C-P lyase system protein PhnH [Burkholderia cepacia]